MSNLPPGVTPNQIPGTTNRLTDDEINNIIEPKAIEEFLMRVRPTLCVEWACDEAANGLQCLPKRIREPLIEWYRKHRLDRACDELRWERETRNRGRRGRG